VFRYVKDKEIHKQLFAVQPVQVPAARVWTDFSKPRSKSMTVKEGQSKLKRLQKIGETHWWAKEKLLVWMIPVTIPRTDNSLCKIQNTFCPQWQTAVLSTQTRDLKPTHCWVNLQSTKQS
jgi:hypothetical protein